jgi:hypothetical protein
MDRSAPELLDALLQAGVARDVENKKFAPWAAILTG